MKQVLETILLCLGTAGVGMATSCGTFAGPTSCSITLGGNITYTVSAFALLNSSAAAGGNLYQAGDVSIDIGTGGGNSLLMTFSKLSGGPTPGVVFSANQNDSSAFTLQYSVALSTLAAGTVAFAPPSIVDFGTSSALGNGISQSQMVLPGTPSASCAVFRNTNIVSPGTCATLPGGLGLTLSVGDIVTLNGGTPGGGASNTSIGSITNQFNATFTPGSGAPEPTTFVLMGLGLAGLPMWRRVSARPATNR